MFIVPIRLKLIRTAVLVCVAMSLFSSVALAQQSTATKKVLVLYWYDKDFPFNASFERGFQAALKSAPAGTVEYYPEYLESNRFPGENQSQLLHDYLRQKYADRTIDVVIASGYVTLDFLCKHPNDLFPNTPIVFLLTTHPTTEQLVARPGLTGIITLNTYRKTLDLALSLHPATQHVFVISGTLERDKKLETLAREELQGYESRVRINYLTDLQPDQLVAKMKNLPGQSIVLYVWHQAKTAHGDVLEFADILTLIAQSAPVPTYGMASWHVGSGIVGGYVNTPETTGTRAAEIALRILNGARAQDIPVQSDPAVPMFDWRELRRWGIGEAQLPPGSIVRFKEFTFWQQYKWRIIGVIAVILLQALLIAGLLVERGRRWRASRRLAESEKRFRTMANSAPVMIWVANQDKLCTWFNQHWLEFTGRTMEQELGNGWSENVHADDLDRCLEAYVTAFEARRPFSMEYRVRRQDGAWRWLFDTGVPTYGANQQFAGYIGSRVDVTEQKMALEAIQESEERFAKVFKANPQPMSLCTLAEGRYLDVNESFLTMSGCTREEIIGRTSLDLGLFDSPEERSALLVEPLLKSGVARNFETNFRTKSGGIRMLLSSAELLELGGEQCIVVASIDITERKILEDELQRTEREFSTLVQNSPDVISRLDRTLRYIYVSPILERTTEIPPQQFIGKTPSEISLKGYDGRDFEAGCRKALTTMQIVNRDFEYNGRNYSTRIIPEFSSAGAVDSLMTISQDVTDRIRAEQQLRELTVRLFQLQDEEQRRIAAELHDGLGQRLSIIRNRAILCMLDISDQESVHEQLEEISATAVSAIDEVREIAHNLRPYELDRLGLAAAVESMVSKVSDATSIHLSSDLDHIDGLLSSEAETSVYRIVQEGLNNVVKHAEASEACVGIKRTVDEIIVSIQDNGIGITMKGEPENGDNGRGFGLAGIAERARMLRGVYEVNSKPGCGTTLTVRLKLSDKSNGQ